MDKLQAFSSLLGAFYMAATALHVVFPNVKAFQVLGAALRKFGP